jgi:hypothetical protein
MCRRSRRACSRGEFVKPVRVRNPLGTAAFLTSLSGILLCGLTFPIGLLMGLIALARGGPRTAAWAGTLLGGLGTALLAGLVLLIAAENQEGVRVRRFDPNQSRTGEIIAELEERIIDVEVQRGEPLSEHELSSWVVSTRDGWDRPLRLDLAPNHRRRLISAGRDGRFGTDDDVEQALGAP